MTLQEYSAKYHAELTSAAHFAKQAFEQIPCAGVKCRFCPIFKLCEDLALYADCLRVMANPESPKALDRIAFALNIKG